MFKKIRYEYDSRLLNNTVLEQDPPKNKKLSIVSPLAKGLIGKLKGDIVEINSPKGLKTYKIISVKYIWIQKILLTF